MSNELSFETIQQLGDKTPISSVRGKLIAVYEFKDPDPSHTYPKSRQGASLKQGDSVMTVSFENHEDVSCFKGKDVVISCWQSPKGPTGVMVNEYNGKKSIRVTKAGMISEVGAGEPQPVQQPTQQSVAPQHSNQTQQVHAPNLSPNGELAFKQRLAQLANAEMLVRRGVEVTCSELEKSGYPVPAEERLAMVGRWFIGMTQRPFNEAVDMSKGLPTNKYVELPDNFDNVERQAPPPKAEPAPAPEPEPEVYVEMNDPAPAIKEPMSAPAEEVYDDSNVPF